MIMKVEVEIEDLETIIFATAIIKSIESSLQQRKQDPFIKPHLDYSKASEALTQAMNYARRSEADTKIAWDGILSKNEVALLKEFVASDTFEVTAEFRLKTKEIDQLAAKGCIRIGQLVSGAVWPGEARPDIRPVQGFALAITQRGKDKLSKLLDSTEPSMPFNQVTGKHV